MTIKKTYQSDYSKKLLDPRWQKKRLEIFERDGWCCQKCHEHEITLHVHHMIYQSSNPWETENKYLLTLCEDCHSNETKYKKALEGNWIKLFSQAGFFFKDLEWELCMYEPIEPQHTREVVLSSLFYALSNVDAQKSLVRTFLDSLKKKQPEPIDSTDFFDMIQTIGEQSE